MTNPQAFTDPDLERTLSLVRGRWRWRRALAGSCAVLACTAAAAFVAAGFLDAERFDPLAVSLARSGVYLLALAAVAGLAGALFLRGLPEGQVPLRLERYDPELDALLLSAVEARGSAGRDTSPALVERLVAAAGAACRRLDHGRVLERMSLRRGWLAVIVVAIAVLAGWQAAGPGLRHGLALLAMPWRAPVDGIPYQLDLSPRDVTVAWGSNQLVVAHGRGFIPRLATLEWRPAGSARTWERAEMIATPDAGGFEAYLLDIREETEFRVVAEGITSPTRAIEVVRVPRIEQIDLRYRYPDYTGRGVETVEDGADIEAVVGTEVTIRVYTDIPAAEARLVLDDTTTIALDAVDPGTGDSGLEGVLRVERDGRYHVELPGLDGALRAATPEHSIVALPDNPPTISLDRPGRDAKVTAIEELEIAIHASDDLGVREVDLVVSFNSGAAEVIALPPGQDLRDARLAHVLALEERGLEPGDLVAYHVRASDGAPGSDRTVLSDPYFLEVRPFDRAYRRAAGGGGGGGGGGGDEGVLAAQQRALVVATFKTVRERARLEDDTFAGRVTTLAEGQTRIRARVDAIVRRLGARSLLGSGEGYQRMAEELPKASAAMLRVEALLAVRDVDGALEPARAALRHLQRADAAFREVQIAQGNQGGGGRARDADDLANLFRLEMDRFGTQYESINRPRPRGGEAAIDEALERLRELARRQQREREQAEARSRLGASGQPSGDGSNALAAELEELARMLERLTRERPEPELQASARALREAARSLRAQPGQGENQGQSQSQSQGQGQGQSQSQGQGESQGGTQTARTAEERLREAERELERRGVGRLRREVAEALDRSQALVTEQDEVSEAVRSLASDAQSEPREGRANASDDGTRDTARDALGDRKEQMASTVRELEQRLGRLARGARAERPEVANELDGAARALGGNDLAEEIEWSSNAIGGGESEEIEARIGQSLREARDRVASAARAAGEPGQGDVARAARELRELLGGMQGSGGADGGAAVAGRALGGGSRADVTAPDIARLRARMAGEARSLAWVRGELGAAGRESGDIEAVIDALESLAAQDAEALAGDEFARQRAALLLALQDAERRLRLELEGHPPGHLAAREPGAEPAWRSAVDEYYRRLSERPPGTSR